MQLRIYDPRVIAIDLRHRRCGFAVFEGPSRILDCGTFALPGGELDHSDSRFREFLRLVEPAIAVLKKERWDFMNANPEIIPVLKFLSKRLKTNGISIRLLKQNSVDTTFAKIGCTTKAEISAALARVFPELVWRIPPERKPWQSEHSRQSVFDAIALGLAYWENETSYGAVS